MCHQGLLLPLRDQWLGFLLVFDLVRLLPIERYGASLGRGQLSFTLISLGFVRFYYCGCRPSGTRASRSRCGEASGLA